MIPTIENIEHQLNTLDFLILDSHESIKICAKILRKNISDYYVYSETCFEEYSDSKKYEIENLKIKIKELENLLCTQKLHPRI